MSFVIENGVLKKYQTFNVYREMEVVVPDEVKVIGKRAFMFADFRSIKIPDGVTEIGEAAFMECSDLTEIVLPKSIDYIGDRAFSHCHRLKRAVIPEGISYIGDDVFECCSKSFELITYKSETELVDQKQQEDLCTIERDAASRKKAFLKMLDALKSRATDGEYIQYITFEPRIIRQEIEYNGISKYYAEAKAAACETADADEYFDEVITKGSMYLEGVYSDIAFAIICAIKAYLVPDFNSVFTLKGSYERASADRSEDYGTKRREYDLNKIISKAVY